MIVFLVGYMGCGKTTIGRRLARRLGYDFADTDDRIEKQEGADVCDIFHYAGEEYFRKAERGMLEQLIASGDDLVVSTGGGLPVWADNMARMNGAGPPFCGADRSAFESSRTLEAPQVEGTRRPGAGRIHVAQHGRAGAVLRPGCADDRRRRDERRRNPRIYH